MTLYMSLHASARPGRSGPDKLHAQWNRAASRPIDLPPTL